MARRFVVRELLGYAITPGASSARHLGARSRPGLTIWVADELAHGREVRVWRTEELPRALRYEDKLHEVRCAAREYASTCNSCVA